MSEKGGKNSLAMNCLPFMTGAVLSCWKMGRRYGLSCAERSFSTLVKVCNLPHSTEESTSCIVLEAQALFFFFVFVPLFFLSPPPPQGKRRNGKTPLVLSCHSLTKVLFFFISQVPCLNIYIYKWLCYLIYIYIYLYIFTRKRKQSRETATLALLTDL